MRKSVNVLLLCLLTASVYTVEAVSLQEIKAFLNKSVHVKVKINGVKWQREEANGTWRIRSRTKEPRTC